MAEQAERLVRCLLPSQPMWSVSVPATCTDGATQVHAGFCAGLGPARSVITLVKCT